MMKLSSEDQIFLDSWSSQIMVLSILFIEARSMDPVVLK